MLDFMATVSRTVVQEDGSQVPLLCVIFIVI